MNWPKIKKKLAFKALSPFILCNNNEPFLDGSWHDEKWILYNNQWLAQWLDWEEAPKHFPKSQICNKNRSWSLVVCCPSIHYNFLNSGKTNTSEKYAQQIQLRCTKTAMVKITGPILLHNNDQPQDTELTFQKLNEVLPHLQYSPDLLPSDYHFFNFLQGKCFHNRQEAENTFQEFVES